jgi:hypothetical protein
MLKRLFIREEQAVPSAEPGLPGPVAETRASGTPLILLVPGVAGVSIYQMRSFPDAHAAAAFIESCNPYRIYKEGIIAFWAVHERPPHDHDAECAVLVRTEPSSDLVHAYAFADLDSATSYVRFRIEETDEAPDAFVVYWAASIRINSNPSGEVRLEPSTPPMHVRPMRPLPASPATLEDEPAITSEVQIADIPNPSPSEPAQIPAEVPAKKVIPSAEPETHARPDVLVVRRQQELPAPTQTRWDRKTPRKTPAKVKAHVLALGLLGSNARDIESDLRAMFPGERVPTRATIARWLKRAGISRANLKKWETMSEHAMRILEKRLAELHEAPLSEVARVATLLEGMRRK